MTQILYHMVVFFLTKTEIDATTLETFLFVETLWPRGSSLFERMLKGWVFYEWIHLVQDFVRAARGGAN